jgi:ribosomal protein L21E
MASKRSTTKRAPGNRGTTKSELKRVSREAKAEVTRLLQRSRAGEITRVQLDTGLREVRDKLMRIGVFIWRV